MKGPRAEGFIVMRTPYYADGLEDLIAWINTHRPTSEMRMLEIGSYVGESTLQFAKHFKQVVSIDPYIENYDDNDLACNAWPLSWAYNRFLENTMNHSNIKSIRMTSDEALNVVNKYRWDFIYIDALHTYEGVKNDIQNYRGLLVSGGFLAGHDYGWEGVRQAVDENLIVSQTFKDTSWITKL
jgi:predicted O-methyltransferase YrrM